MKNRIALLSLVSSLFLVGCSNEETVSKQSYNTMYEHLVYCWKQSLEGIHFDNAFYGDSRVIGAGFTEEFKEKSVVNLGVSGDKVKDCINRFGLIKTVTPKRVFLAIGGNDALSNQYSKDTFISDYSELLKLFKDGNYDVVVHNVVGVTTVNSNFDKKLVDEKNAKISEINEVIKSKAEEYKFTFLDIASVMNKDGSNEMNGNYSTDGVHFNDKGNKVWYNAIKDLLI